MVRDLLTASVSALLLAAATPALAADGTVPQTAWSEIRGALYGEREMIAASPAVTLETPYRAENDLRVPMRVTVDLPSGEAIERVTLIIDENPMPVSADFEMNTPVNDFTAEVSMRFNGPTMVHAVVETATGDLLVSEAMVKTSGVGACAAPPTTGVEEALATLGDMTLDAPTILRGAGPKPREVALDISHPQHSGMQMDQITLHYILARYVQTVEAFADDEPLFTMTGSISLSEDPEIRFNVPKRDVSALRVRMTDTEGAMFQKTFSLGGS
ncbi:quinoprotein dehydrogenase-associated SoxYZ-like carrier [Fulvimarina sp. 2208YS6-2-32]|uniref:Quinoprotein dehydrogenase-associated SoxYZ-like carrier n=1 Tax=Fulvimarina uroteuthidis TaxID=3098149 RepID=A0ABU5I5J9_9HYPH|nr:quinoprotein dehydrogenase-associated SoxYZ-like carrier [Fulvimarina sp. 2208YS6-2-32]MDY8110486.1 quinoprotein dehydrogenase-associated SoxYZ-like carrier [Fulvimarina sp. 2208YS6-2-32]